jgi:serine-type D-Ala-D-Ala carboxypeptidase (penicillin-binding protein 5/6)
VTSADVPPTRRALRRATTSDDEAVVGGTSGTDAATSVAGAETPASTTVAELAVDADATSTSIETVALPVAASSTAEATAAGVTPEPAAADDSASAPEPASVLEPAEIPAAAPLALAWVDPATILPRPEPSSLTTATTPYIPVETDLLAKAPRRSPWRPGVLVPTALVVVLVGIYCAVTLLWPLHAIPPQVTADTVKPVAAPAAAIAWPAKGSGAVSVQGISGAAASTTKARAIASITKVVTALVVLDAMPLNPGEQGPSFHFTSADSAQYWSYLRQNESALDVPVGGSLSEYQMLEGMLIGSAGNYADRLAGNLWPTDAAYANAAETWLQAHGVRGISIVEPTGIEAANSASPGALLTLAQKAMANPIIAEIVGKKSVDLPGAGHVVNTNGLLADPGVVGIKTGSLDAFNLLAAKDVKIGDTTVRMYASTLGQPDEKTRISATRALFAQLEKELQLRPSVASGTIVGEVTTRWGETVPLKTTKDADVVLWNGGTATVATAFALGEHRDAGDVVGTLTATGPLDTTDVNVALAHDIEGPDAWWRLTHPLDLLGLNG